MKADDNRPTDVRSLSGAMSGMHSELRLMVVIGEDVRSHRLQGEGVILIGRAAESDIQISDSTISRRHAALILGPQMYIEDFGSLNGTRVKGRQLQAGERETFEPGEILELGDAMLVVQRKAVPLQPLQIHEGRFFDARLKEAYERAKQSRTAFAILLVRSGDNVPGDVLDNALRVSLRDHDVLSSAGSRSHRILLPDTTPAMVEDVLRRFRKGLGAHQTDVHHGAACFPRDARDPEALLERAEASLAEQPVIEDAGPFVLEDESMKGLHRLIERIAPTDMNVLVRGETGVGKEVVARLLHRLSKRPASLFLGVNCASLPDQLLESELFGHEKGAFTGASRAKPGLLEAAKNGSFLLDEITEMPLNLQAKLLRVIEQRQATRIGGLKPYRIRARFIATTNRDIENEVRQGNFRQDLFFRLDGISLLIPPLRERPAEIQALARLFAKQTFQQLGRTTEPGFSDEALAWLEEYRWPGNVRELRNVIERSALLSTDGRITLELVASGSAGPDPGGAATAPPQQEAGTAALSRVQTRLNLPRYSRTQRSFKQEVQDLEHRRILEALDQTGGNQTEAARILGISRRTLINRLEQFGIQRPRKGLKKRGK